MGLESWEPSATAKISQIRAGVTVNKRKSSGIVRKWGNRRDPRKDLSKQINRSTQEEHGRKKDSTRYECAKYTHPNVQVSYAVYRYCKVGNTYRGIRRIYRPKGCLLAYPYTSENEAISSIQNRTEKLSVQSHAFRAKPSTKSFFKSDESGTSKTVERRCLRLDVFRRLANNSHHERRMPANGRNNNENRQGNGIAIQSEKIPPASNHTNRMVRSEMEYIERDSRPIRRKPDQMRTESVQISELKDYVPETMGVVDRQSKSCSDSDSIWETESSASDSSGKRVIRQSTARHLHSNSEEHPQQGEMVGQGLEVQEDGPFRAPGTRDDFDDGRVRLGLGIPDVPGSPDGGFVVGILEVEIHQPPRDENSGSGTPERNIPTEQVYTSSIRQSGNGLCDQQARIIEISDNAATGGGPISMLPTAGNSSISPTCGRDRECMGRFTLQTSRVGSRMGVELGHILPADGDVWRTRSGFVRNPPESKSTGVPVTIRENICRRPGCYVHKLEQMEEHISLSTTSNSPDGEDHHTFEGFSRSSANDSTLLASTAVDVPVTPLVSEAETTGGELHGEPNECEADAINALSRVEFLRKYLKEDLPKEVVEDIICAHRQSTSRQYESAWKKFQSFVTNEKVQRVDKNTFVKFASFLFHKRKLSPSSVNVHLAAITDPLKFAFNISPDKRALELIRNSYFHQRPAKKTSIPKWNLQKVLDYLSQEKFMVNPSNLDKLHKAIFLVALATGLRISQLAALIRTPGFCIFRNNEETVSLAPNPKFLAKNEREKHRLQPIEVVGWKERDNFHPLCPVRALKLYIERTKSSKGRLWLLPDSMKECTKIHIAKIICRVIEAGDPGNKPTAHQVRGYAATLAYLRTFDTSEVREAGQWASAYSLAQIRNKNVITLKISKFIT